MEPIPTRLKAGTPGLGEASQTEIEQRARELAQSDGRPVFSAADLIAARAELGGGIVSVQPPEAPGLESLFFWDGPLDEAGHRVQHTSEDDEVNIGERLVQAGIEEADHSQRVAAEEKEP